MKAIKIKDIAIDGEPYESTLPLTPEQIKQGPWRGAMVGDGRFVRAEIWESSGHPGYYNCRVIGIEVSETKRPVSVLGVGIMMDSLLSHHGTESRNLRWERDVTFPPPSYRAKKTERGEIVYFLRAGDFVKIGKATGSTTARVNQLKTGCPFPIEVMATINGGLDKERSLHEQFSHIRAHGEWFHAAPELLSFIKSAGGVA